MAKAEILTPVEYWKVYEQLLRENSTYSDIWYFIYHASMKIGDALKLKYSDIENNCVTLRDRQQNKTGLVRLNAAALNVVNKRRRIYPQDTYLFQSHSNRVKYLTRPVTVIAFNQALKVAAAQVTSKNVSSQSARKSRAAAMLEKGVELERVSLALNHRDLAFTRAYLEMEKHESVDA